jgi:predicted amidophosphoribosyltransferase
VQFLETLLPSTCAGCRKVGRAICADCLDELRPNPRRVVRGISGWSVIDYGPIATNTINAFKEHGRTALLGDFCKLLDEIEISDGVVLVGLPSAQNTTRKRGFVPAELLAERLARRRLLGSAHALVFNRKIDDQAKLSKLEREANLVGAMLAKPVTGAVVLIDDVVTTGASLNEAARAMAAAGNQVVGFVTIAETILRNDI